MRPEILRPLDLNKTTIIDGVEVTPICANHCPGAVCFIFRVPSPQKDAPPTVILHTGDFRWCSKKHGQHPALVNGVDILMLDSTYLQPKWTFPPQEEAIARMADIMRTEAAENDSKTLFVCSSYHIGKERAYLGVAKILNWKVWVPKTKRKVLDLLDLPLEWVSLLTDNEYEAQIHVYSSRDDTHEQSLADRISKSNSRWTRVFFFRATGWTYRRTGTLERREEGCVTIIGIPYSEHSSYTELQECVKTLRPRKLIPTVNAGDAVKSRALVDRLCGLMDLSEDKTRLDSYFLAAAGKGGNGSQLGQGSGSKSGDASQQQQQPEAAAAEEEANIGNDEEEEFIDLDGIDIEEQKRLFEEAARSQGNNRKRQASSSLEKNKGGSSSGGSSRGKDQQNGSNKRGSILAYFSKPAS